MEIRNKNKKYNASAHLVYSCQYHVIFCPKYRRSVLVDGIDTRLKEIFLEVADKFDFKVLESEIMPNHVHLLIDCNPRFGILNCVNRLKSVSVNKINKEFPQIKTRLPNLWTRSAFISTVGSVSLEVVKSYIEKQKTV